MSIYEKKYGQHTLHYERLLQQVIKENCGFSSDKVVLLYRLREESSANLNKSYNFQTFQEIARLGICNCSFIFIRVRICFSIFGSAVSSTDQ